MVGIGKLAIFVSIVQCLETVTVIFIDILLSRFADGIDGKQARRTKTSGPLGELFDHGLDSWTTVFIPTCLYSVFGRSDFSISPWRMYFCLWNVFACFFISHWEKYNTGVLFLPWGYDYSMVVSSSRFNLFIIFVATFDCKT
jgi:ethanolaminephosphotransferase